MRSLIVLMVSVLSVVSSAFAQDDSFPSARCNESVFKPCVCSKQVPEEIKYRPRAAECGGRAAAILEGKYAKSFSVVLRDRENRDRYPSSGFNGCTKAEADLGLGRCSAYKCQKVSRKNGKLTCCFGAPGDSKILSKASRMTIKLKDVPDSSLDPLLRVCLSRFSPKVELN